MNGMMLTIDAPQSSDREEFRDAVLEGLSRRKRAIPARFLYDASGSALFDEICDLPEYYLTRTETEILAARAPEIARLAGPGSALVEFGAGSSVKSRLLLDAMTDLAIYAPIDISRQHLDLSAARLRRDYPRLRIEPVCADYTTLRSLPNAVRATHRLGFFPGSTIGNLEPAEAESFLRGARCLLGDDGDIVVGVDLRKDPRELHDAYNDAACVTAAFTLNLLRRMNRELDASFEIDRFAHEAFYNPKEGRIEIYFRSLVAQDVRIAGRSFAFAEGERVHTEYSYKYDRPGIEALARTSGFQMTEFWTDAAARFAVVCLHAAP
jgi:dimethylhistidine N-methyltransferase